jgi:hypothetical protein
MSQQGSGVSINLSQATTVICEYPECGNATFTQTFIIKHVSAILSPVGKEGIVPVPVFTCNACGGVNTRLLPPELRPAQRDDNGVSPSAETKPRLILDK